MNGTLASEVLEVLSDPRLLTPEQFAELSEQLYARCPDWVVLGPELIYRGWLTPYQMQQVLEGNGAALFLGSYVLLSPLAEGGMGRVFRARNWKLDKTVALKVIRSDMMQNEAMVRRFRREILAFGQVAHPNIVHAFDADVSGNVLYYAMEYVRGIDLGRLVHRDGPLDVSEACHYVAQTAQALHYAHQFGLVHRDVKPTNLLLAPETRTIKLLDLGLARFDVVDDGRTQLTRVGSLVGTPDYVAPEQVQDSHRADIRSDLYSLGCTFYYLLCGEAPFGKEEIVDKLYCHIREQPEPILLRRADLPTEVGQIVDKLLEKDPRDRYQEPIELLDALLPFVRGGAGVPLTWSNGHQSAILSSFHVMEPLPATQVVNSDDLNLLRSPPSHADEALPEPSPQPRVLSNPLQTLIAMAIALAALLIIWKSGGGPRRAETPPARVQPVEGQRGPVEKEAIPPEVS